MRLATGCTAALAIVLVAPVGAQVDPGTGEEGCVACHSRIPILELSRPIAVLVNAIAPGFIETDMTSGLPDEMKDSTRSRIPLKRFGDPEEVASGVIFLASSYSNYIVGHVLRIDGGLVMQG